jgi:hypothetical protein
VLNRQIEMLWFRRFISCFHPEELILAPVRTSLVLASAGAARGPDTNLTAPFAPPLAAVYWRTSAMWIRFSVGMRWSWLSSPMSICTQAMSPENLLPVGR